MSQGSSAVMGGDIVDKIMSYEAGEMKGEDVLDFFSELVKTGTVWSLQGTYGRSAKQLIDSGFLNKEGDILRTMEERSDEG